LNINFGINFDGILKFNKSFWVKVGSWAVNQIRSDAQQGIFQTDEPVKKTYSTEYAQLKERRFTHNTKRRYVVNEGGMEYGSKDVFRKKDGRKGERYEQFKGVSIVSTNTSFVDMTVTGQTLRGLKITETTPNGVQVSFNIRDLWKIVGNQKPGLNRRLVGLNNKNMKRLQELFINEVATQVAKNFVGKTVLNFKL